MNEKIDIELNQEALEKQEWEERYEQWMKDHSYIEILKEKRRECGPEILQFEEMLATFETIHSLEELSSIIDLTPQEAPKNLIREWAKADLVPIVALLNVLEEETNISTEKLKELKVKYRRLSRAVGMINNNKVNHNR